MKRLLVFGVFALCAHAVTWRDAQKQPGDWYGTAEAIRIADNLLLYQHDIGGWDKNIDMAAGLSAADRAKLEKEKHDPAHSTIDNDSTYCRCEFGGSTRHAEDLGAAFRRGFGVPYEGAVSQRRTAHLSVAPRLGPHRITTMRWSACWRRARHHDHAPEYAPHRCRTPARSKRWTAVSSAPQDANHAKREADGVVPTAEKTSPGKARADIIAGRRGGYIKASWVLMGIRRSPAWCGH